MENDYKTLILHPLVHDMHERGCKFFHMSGLVGHHYYENIFEEPLIA